MKIFLSHNSNDKEAVEAAFDDNDFVDVGWNFIFAIDEAVIFL